jgi:hypothetical protein
VSPDRFASRAGSEELQVVGGVQSDALGVSSDGKPGAAADSRTVGRDIQPATSAQLHPTGQRQTGPWMPSADDLSEGKLLLSKLDGDPTNDNVPFYDMRFGGSIRGSTGQHDPRVGMRF